MVNRNEFVREFMRFLLYKVFTLKFYRNVSQLKKAKNSVNTRAIS